MPTGAERSRGGVALSAVAPGLPQLLAGRVGPGLGALLPWLGGVHVLATRPELVSSQLGTGSVEGGAAVVVLAAAGLAWAWSLGDVSRETAVPDDRLWGRLVRDRWAVAGMVVLVGFAWMAAASPLLAPEASNRVFSHPPDLSPSWTHPMGTDALGTDVLHRFLRGARATLGVGFGAGLLGALAGVTLGAAAGYLGGWFDRLAMRTVDFFIAFPKLVLLIAVVAVFDPTPLLLAAFIAFTQWPAMARVVRGEVIGLRQRDFVHALRALGMSRRRILVAHVLPNAQATILVGMALAVANALLIEAGLGFLGIGMGGTDYGASWGLLVRDGAALLPRWWVGGFAGLALVVVVAALNLVADALRDALDPRTEVHL